MTLQRIYTLACGYAFLAAILSITPLALYPLNNPVVQLPHDKANHILAFCVLAFLSDQYLMGSFATLKKRWISFACVLAYGVLLEIFQSFIPNRDGSLWDILADVMGLFIGYTLSIFSSIGWQHLQRKTQDN